TISKRDWSSYVCSSDLENLIFTSILNAFLRSSKSSRQRSENTLHIGHHVGFHSFSKLTHKLDIIFGRSADFTCTRLKNGNKLLEIHIPVVELLHQVGSINVLRRLVFICGEHES